VLGWLATQGVPTTGWVIDNGSGLSRKTLVDPKGLAQFLRNMAQRPDFPDYLASFPRAGADGTVRKRMNEVDGYAYLKTGSLSGTRSVAGYVRAQDRQWWAVAIMVRSPNAAESWPGMEGVIEFIYRSR
jgi:D-alanyl-D-alanine carboxypeptidase/D-alanyl-D-alanine-endopeptidase (penicillin-binding protein 4)